MMQTSRIGYAVPLRFSDNAAAWTLHGNIGPEASFCGIRRHDERCLQMSKP